ncbi:hypothetical protein B0H10DRAFT_2193622 [Mycena sp. CBHHK59/15]|nr:hypothetical protein B0H10DRAFT_2193622 [Mycena sp. CBHHK59/15]
MINVRIQSNCDPASNSSTSHHRVRAAYCTSTSSHCKRANPTQVTPPIIPARTSDLGTYASLVFPTHAAPRRLRKRAPASVLKTPKMANRCTPGSSSHSVSPPGVRTNRRQAVILAACFALRKSVGIRPRSQNVNLTHTNTGTPTRAMSCRGGRRADLPRPTRREHKYALRIHRFQVSCPQKKPDEIWLGMPPGFHVRETMPARRHSLSLLTNHGGAGYSSPPYAYQSLGQRQSQFNFGTPSCAPVVALPQNKLYGGAYDWQARIGSCTSREPLWGPRTSARVWGRVSNFWPSRRGEYCADAPAPKSNQNPKRRAPPGEEPHSRLMGSGAYLLILILILISNGLILLNFTPTLLDGTKDKELLERGAGTEIRVVQYSASRRAFRRTRTSKPRVRERWRCRGEGDRDRSAANGGISRSGSGSLGTVA